MRAIYGDIFNDIHQAQRRLDQLKKRIDSLHREGGERMSDYEPRIVRNDILMKEVLDNVEHELNKSTPTLTLPTDSAERKEYPMLSGCLNYFPAALAGVSKVSKQGNEKHNPGQPLHHARGKSTDHGDCIVRHLTDTEDLLAAFDRKYAGVTPEQILIEASQLAWRALAYSQELHERFGAPLAPAASTKINTP
jgi:hypothetical protein